MKNVISVEDGLSRTRLALYEHLKGCKLNVVLCDQSKFYHIGTVPEYRYHYCQDPFIRSELQMTARAVVSGEVGG